MCKTCFNSDYEFFLSIYSLYIPWYSSHVQLYEHPVTEYRSVSCPYIRSCSLPFEQLEIEMAYRNSCLYSCLDFYELNTASLLDVRPSCWLHVRPFCRVINYIKMYTYVSNVYSYDVLPISVIGIWLKWPPGLNLTTVKLT